MIFDDVVKLVEDRGCSWAVDGIGDGKYTAILSLKGDIYVADALASGLGAESGATPAEALHKALLAYR